MVTDHKGNHGHHAPAGLGICQTSIQRNLALTVNNDFSAVGSGDMAGWRYLVYGIAVILNIRFDAAFNPMVIIVHWPKPGTLTLRLFCWNREPTIMFKCASAMLWEDYNERPLFQKRWLFFFNRLRRNRFQVNADIRSTGSKATFKSDSTNRFDKRSILWKPPVDLSLEWW